MTKSQQILIKQSEAREKLNGLLAIEPDERTEDQRGEVGTLTDTLTGLEPELRASLAAEGPTVETHVETMDSETRERLELRGRATFGGFLLAALQGRVPAGAEAEYAAAFGAQAGGVPMDLWEVDRPVETRAATPAPTTGTGATTAPVQPFVFAPSIAPRLGIDMPQVGSGGYSELTISTSVPAGAVVKGGNAADTAGALTSVTANPRRVSARVTLTVEDVAQIGQANFEAALRQNVSMKLSAEVDHQIVNGDGSSPDINGILNQLTAVAAGSAVATFDDFVALVADRVDGLWAGGTPEIAMVVNPETYRLAAKTFRGTAANGGPVVTASAFLKDTSGAFWTNERMPDKSSHVASAIAYRMGRMGLRTACLPTWGTISIDDIYTDSRSGQRSFVVHALVGDKVLIVQPAAYVEASVRISS